MWSCVWGLNGFTKGVKVGRAGGHKYKKKTEINISAAP